MLTAKQKEWMDEYIFPSWSETPNGIDVRGSVNLSGLHLEEIPVKFNIIWGDFMIYSNRLISLENSPNVVYGTFNCALNPNLKSLKGGPKEVQNYKCHKNKQITSLEGSPDIVSHVFDCSDTCIKNLKGSPEKIGGAFDCSRTKLETFEGCPKYIGFHLFCSSNPIKTMKHLKNTDFQRGNIVCNMKGMDDDWFSKLYLPIEGWKHWKRTIMDKWEVPTHLREKLILPIPVNDDLYKLASLIKAKY